MNFNIAVSLFKEGLNKILTVIDKKNSRPILTNCLIKASGNHLEIIATDLEVTAKVLLPAEIKNVGSFCINTKNIFDIVRELPDETLSMEVDSENNLLNIECKNINYSLLITNSDEYPMVHFESSNESFILKSEDILKIITKTFHAISNDETRINLNGIYLQQIDSQLRSVAIDGHRLALVDINNFESQNSSLLDGVIIPKKGITELKKIADINPEQDIKISLDESFMYINASDKYYLSIRLIAREYPKYQTVIPSKTIHSLIVERSSLLNAVRRIKILANEKTNGIKISLKENEMTISANHPSLGNANETIQIEYKGEEIEIGFNANYIIDALSILDVNEIIYEFNNELSPVVVKSNEAQNFLGIIMPLKL